jgi:uncharacterized RDD family membrane protein YckC
MNNSRDSRDPRDQIDQPVQPIHGLFSPEGVRLELAVAGPAPRMFAYGIDWLIVILLLVLLLVSLFTSLPLGALLDKWVKALLHEASAATREQRPDPELIGRVAGVMIALFVLAQFVVETGYFIFCEMVTGGRSPGKALVGLRVVRRDGMPLDFRSSVVRNVMRIVDMLPANYLVGLVAMLLSDSGERLGDHVAGTVVVRLDRPEAAAEIQTPERPAAFSLTRQQLARIGPRELQLIRTTLRRMASLPEARRRPLLEEVAETVRARLEIAEFPSPDKAAFLEDVLAMAERHMANI